MGAHKAISNSGVFLLVIIRVIATTIIIRRKRDILYTDYVSVYYTKCNVCHTKCVSVSTYNYNFIEIEK